MEQRSLYTILENAPLAQDVFRLRLLGDAAEAFLLTQLERGFRTLDFYKQIRG